MPKDVDTIALWYNKTMFDQAGIKYPDASWTWDTFRAAAKKLTKADGSQYGYTLRPSEDQTGWYNMVYSMGGEIISAGKVAMVTMGSWTISTLCNNDYVKAHCNLAVLPKDAATGKRISIYNGLGWAAAANTKNPDAAWALIEYLGTKPVQQKHSDLGVAISAYQGTAAKWVSTYPAFNLQAHLDMLADIVMRPYSKTTVKRGNMAIDKLINLWTGKVSAEPVCKDIAVKMNKILKEE